jgi:hypothetical protein
MSLPALIKKLLKALEICAGSEIWELFTVSFSTFSFTEALFMASFIKDHVFLGSFFAFFSPSSKYILLLALTSLVYTLR